MKVYAEPEINTPAMFRLAAMLKRYAPDGVGFVKDKAEADHVVHVVVGIETPWQPVPIDQMVEQDLAAGRTYSIIQCCILSTGRQADADLWCPIWDRAAVVWSYLDLTAISTMPAGTTNFYYAPLGVDGRVFNRTNERGRDITCVTTGFVAESEAILAVSDAVRRVDGWHVHIGPDLGFGDHVTAMQSVSDQRLASLYKRARFVAGLRRGEGFELPAAEGLVCGARPVMFDAPHYKRWFGSWAAYVPEVEDPEVADRLTDIFTRTEAFRVDPSESDAARGVFDWQRLVTEFWRRARVQADVQAPVAEVIS